MNTSRFTAGFGRAPSRTRSFGSPVIRKPALDPGALHHYWHPDRPGVEPAPSHVAKTLATIHPKLRLVRPPSGAPIHTGYHPWVLWFQNQEQRYSLCPGWSLVFIWEDPDSHQPMPLDNRLYANCFMRDPRQFRNGIDYFKGCVDTLAHEDKVKKAGFKQNSFDRQKGLRDYQKIKNIGMGNKFALHHDGSNLASRGETDWRTQTLYERLPDEVRQSAEKEGKNTRKRVTVATGANAQEIRDRNHDAVQLESLKLLRDRREKVGRLLTRSSVGYTGVSR